MFCWQRSHTVYNQQQTIQLFHMFINFFHRLIGFEWPELESIKLLTELLHNYLWVYSLLLNLSALLLDLPYILYVHFLDVF